MNTTCLVSLKQYLGISLLTTSLLYCSILNFPSAPGEHPNLVGDDVIFDCVPRTAGNKGGDSQTHMIVSPFHYFFSMLQ